MKRSKYILIYFLLIAFNGYSQTDPNPFRVWRLTSLSGDLRLRGTYREYKTNRQSANNLQSDYYMNGIIHVNTKSYFVHPNFMILNLTGSYNPYTRRDKYIGVPEYSENYNSEALDASALFFSKKKINLTANAVYNNGIQNIDNISTTKTKNRLLGATLSYRSNFVPLSVGYTKQNIEQSTLGSEARFDFEQRVLQASAGTSFTKNDNHTLDYVYTENSGKETSGILNIHPVTTINKISLFELNDNIAFDSLKNYTFNSTITNSNERGIYNYQRLYARENITLKLPKSLTFSGTYNLWKTKMNLNSIDHRGIQTSLRHQFYKSLTTSVFYENNRTKQNTYYEIRNKLGFNVRYEKKIPIGIMTLSYEYFKERQKVTSDATVLNIVRADYVLNDNQRTLLKNQNIIISTIVVKDVTGTFIYQLNIDYLLLDTKPYVEIVRIPGGMIPNNGTVYIDYTALQAGLYDIYLNNHSFTADFLLFDNKLDLYYRRYQQDYDKNIVSENLVLNYYNRNIIGAGLDLHIIKGGAEYENYSSNILPYEQMKYYVSMQQLYRNVSFTVNGNLAYIYMKIEHEKRRNADISCKIAYTIFKKVKIDFDYMYRNMRGQGIYLDLTTSRLEATTNFHNLFVSLGAEVYWNKERGSTLHYRGTYIQLSRNF